MTNSNPSLSQILVAGAAADGHGALLGWNGLGSVLGSFFPEVLAAAELPADWAPKSKSAIAHAGQAVRRLDNLGLVVRRARKTESRTGVADRWTARWIVSQANAASAEVGEAMGQVVMTAELHGRELRCTGRGDLVAQVTALYEELRDGEVFAAGEVTAWLVRVLLRECGATRIGLGYYIPARSRTIASKLAAAVAARWGSGWIVPLLPIATSDELRVGIARGLADDVAGIASSFAARIATAAEEKRTVRPGEAGALLKSLTAISERLAAYRELVGAEQMAPVIARVNELAADIRKHTDAAAERFAMIEVNDAPVAQPAQPTAEERAAAVKRAAEQRAAEVAAETAKTLAAADAVIDWTELEVLRSEPDAPKPEPIPAPKPASEYEAAMYDRFAGIELD